MNTIPQTTETAATCPPLPALLTAHTFKCPLRLKKSTEEWAEATHLLSAVVPSVLQATTAEEKNSCLCNGVYNVLADCFGQDLHLVL